MNSISRASVAREDGDAKRRQIAVHLMWIVTILIPPFLWLVTICIADVNLPFRDEIDTPGRFIEQDLLGEPVRFSHLMQWHNDSKKLVPSLICFLLYKATGQWSVKWEMAVSIGLGALNCLLVVLVAWLALGERLKRSVHAVYFLGLVFSLYYFAPFTYFRWINGFTMHRVLPETFLLFSLVVFLDSKIKPWVATVLIISSAVLAQFSFSGGIILWPFAMLLISMRGRLKWTARLGQLVVSGSIMLLVQAYYFHDAHSRFAPITENATELPNASMSTIVQYIFSFITTGILHNFPITASAAVGVISCVLVLAFAIRLRSKFSRPIWFVLLVLLSYPVLLAMMAGVSRDWIGSTASRYTLYGAYLPLVVAMVTLAYATQFKQRYVAYVVLIVFGCMYSLSHLSGDAVIAAREHIKSISDARTCLLTSVDETERQKVIAEFVYPANGHGNRKPVERTSRRLKRLIDANVIR